METWAQRDESWVEAGCAVLEGATPWCSDHLAGRCFLLLFGFSWGQIPISPPSFWLWWVSGPAGVWRVQQIHHHRTQWDEGGSGGAQAQMGGGQGDWLVLVFNSCSLWQLWTTRLRKPEQFLREHHPRPVLHAQGSALQRSRDIPSGGGKNNPGSLCFFKPGSRSRVRDIFPFDSSVVEMVTPLSHIKNETL